MSEDLANKIKIVTDSITKNHQPEKIILFGSYAWGKPNADSDVDILVIKDTENTRKEACEIDGDIYPRPFALDLIVFTPKQVEDRIKMGDFFMKNIINSGKILYAR